MNIVEITSDALNRAFGDLISGMASFIPLLILAIIVFIIGWLIAVGVGRLVTDILKRVKFNQIFERGNWKEALEKAELKIDPAGFVGGIFKWVLAIVFLLATVEILGLTEFAIFLREVLGYLPNVIVAALIFVVAIIIADIVEKLVRAGVEGTSVGHGKLVSIIVKWSIWIFAITAILLQLNIAKELVTITLQAVVFGTALTLALAFGLGGRDTAADILRKIKNKVDQ